jgi:hypothetical protein
VKEEEIIELSNSRAPSPIPTIDATGQEGTTHSIEAIGNEEVDDPVQSFLDSLSAATKFLDVPRDSDLDKRLYSPSISSTSSIDAEVNAEGDIIRMGKMPWEAEEEEAAAAKKPKMDNE